MNVSASKKRNLKETLRETEKLVEKSAKLGPKVRVAEGPPRKKKATMSPKVEVTSTKAKTTEKITVAQSTTPNSSKPLIVVAGSYDKILYGLQIEPEKDSGAEFKPVFCFPAHISCVKAVAASPQGGKWLATGATDETIKIWDLRRRKELGSLQQHQGSITHLSFPTRSHLLSTSEDGVICLYHTRDWSVLTTMRGHRERVNDLAVHPSAKVCLSVGKDRTLRMWDLMRGKGSASIKLGKEGEGVRWTPLGTRFAIFSGVTIDIYSTKMSLLQTIDHPARVHGIGFCQDSKSREFLCVAGEDKQVTVYRLSGIDDEATETHSSSPPAVSYLVGHKNRVKALDISTNMGNTYVSTVSSDGRIHLYDMSEALSAEPGSEPSEIQPMASYDTNGSRLTCVVIADGGADPAAGPLQRKRKRESSEEDNDGSSDGEDGG
ncbi:related to MAK11 protein (maintenance of killer toxin-encoding satellite M1 dsRNA) [Serendipita indica DSM 11827]|uniref:Related to MAK11 protein (Maintenance of killer toxin-encoding satellite M1 dsRNA) n=1 Tax=Serendipita indica (strain DSM 11827) TaxID=1109443 RepID=G4TBN7_SERID|nr:related to MAK11 protein (maintenance of killer toxin-encoding satellite M1 dsRNA) [Serendipita indica DSM 11827]